jgi:hypothetical protein
MSKFVRLDQCQRYLRLWLHARSAGMRFLYDWGTAMLTGAAEACRR